jgi:hypothetical protein
MKIRSKVASCAVAFIVFSGAVTVGMAHSQNQSANDSDSTPTSTGEVSSGLTKDGRTYGPLLTSKDGLHEKVPDLVSIEGDNGELGYADSDAVFGEDQPAPSSPEQALLLQAAQAKHPTVVPVFSSDGVTQIDTFTIGGAR